MKGLQTAISHQLFIGRLLDHVCICPRPNQHVIHVCSLLFNLPGANNISVNIPTTDRLDEQLDGDYKVDDLVAWADNLEIDSL